MISWSIKSRVKSPRGISGIILGTFFMLAGVLLVAFPKTGMVSTDDYGDYDAPYPLDSMAQENSSYWMTRRECRICGVVGIFLGAGLISIARWSRWGARRSAIDDYVWDLSLELAWHFERKSHYSIEEVSGVARNSGYNMAYIAYAHAMFCSRADFDDYYGPLHVRCTYDGLRAVVSRHYFSGAYEFDANSFINIATPPADLEFHDLRQF